MIRSPSDLIAEARDHQVRAADPDLSVFVTANAGSGKTTTLVDRVARLLLRNVRPGEILCVTYTKAAAAEMQARLFEKLGLWAVADDRELAASLARLDGRDPASLSGADLSEARRLFARALETPGGLKIQTIHAFCEKLLKRFPLEAGVSPSFRVLENEAAVALSHEAREDLAREALKDADGAIGRAYAHFAVELDWGAFHDLLAKIEAERGNLGAYIDRVDAGTAPGPHALTGADPDRSPADIEGDFLDWIDGAEWERVADAMATGSSNDQKLAAAMDGVSPGGWSVAAMAPVFLTTAGEPRKSMGTKSAPSWAVDFLTDLQLKYLAVRDALRAAKVADDTVKALTLARAHAALYEAAKRRTGALDFADLVARTVELLTRKANAAWVLFKLDGGIEHVLIDEAQDTAPEQWEIFKALTEEFFVGAGAERRRPAREDTPARSVFVVGDQKQSIYSFQGARPERLLKEAQTYDLQINAAGGVFQQVPLATSFRSTPEVLGFVDAVFDNETRAIAVSGDQADRILHAGARAGQHGAVDLWPLFEDPATEDRPAWNAPVDKESRFSGRKRLAQALARDIRRQVQTGVAVHDRGPDGPCRRAARYGDYLVLVRRRDATFEEIIRALKTEGVPVAGADRLKLSSHIVFDDLISVARFALYPEDDLSLAEVLRSPLCDVTDFGNPHSLYPLADAAERQGRSLWSELTRRADEHPEWRLARDLLQAAIDDRERDPFAFFSGVLNRVDATGLSGRGRILIRLGREAEEAIDETLAQVLAAEGRGGVDLETCLSLLEAADVEVKREMEGARDEVRVMTVHGAKGLEAPIVILPDTTSRAKPQGPSLMPVALGPDPDDGEGWLMCPGAKGDDCAASTGARQARIDRTDAESLRLLYVALTRARDRLVVMGRALKRPDTGFEEGSWWAVISETLQRLADREPGAVRDIGDGVLRFGVDPGEAPRSTPVVTEAVAVPAWAQTPPPPDASARFASPSKMDETLRIAAPSPLAVAAGGLGRFRRGDLIHRLLERLPDIAPSDRPDAALRLLARERDLSDDQRAEMIAAAFGVLDDARFAPVFGPGSRAEVALTGTAPELPPGVSVSGRIDRLVITPDRVLVVDFKSNRPAPDRIEDADPAYVTQMAVYAAVLHRLYPDRPVEAALVWTDGPKLMAVPQALMDAALAVR
ncbi:double-strand break repair helicase AddA [Brevundimonas sp. VNH65]|uniref:double-strand break repair helicase AddA n=1 Tax=Brevundimonas sp. VNH65 TaxID=3400917 RepID=UPI003C0E3413